MEFMAARRNPSEGGTFRFGDVTLDADRLVLTRDGREEPLRLKSLEVLLALLRQRGRTVPKEELLAAVWMDAVVGEDALARCVVEIRKAIGDDAKNPRFLKTVARVGYRFVGDVEEESLADATLPVLVEEVDSLEVEIERLPAPVAPPARPALAGRGRLLMGIGLPLAAAAAVLSITLLSRRDSATRLPTVAGRTPVTVLLFENAAQRQDLDWLREGLTDMLVADLSSSGRLSVLSRQQLAMLLARARAPEGKAPGLPLAMELARESGADVFVTGSFTGLGESLRIHAELHDARTGALLIAESATAPKAEELFGQVDLLAGRLLAHLSGSGTAGTPAPGLAVAMTGDVEAYRLYSLAEAQMHGLHTREAIELLEKAIARDPAFAMARARIGYVHAVLWADPDRGRPYLEEAFRASTRLGERDRSQIAAWYSVAKRDYPAAILAYQQMVRISPQDAEAAIRLTGLLLGEERAGEALAVARRILVADPENPALHNLLAGVLTDLRRPEEALAAARRYLELAPRESNAHDTLGGVLLQTGRYQEAIAAFQEALRIKPDFEIAVVHLGNAYLATGQARRAIEEYRRYLAMADSENERRRARSYIALTQLERGHLAEAEREVAGDDGDFAQVLLAIERGDLPAARALHRLWQERFVGRGTRLSSRLGFFLEGSLALRAGEPATALDRFRDALRHHAPFWHIDTFEDCLANGYLALGRLDEAIAEYQRILMANPSYPLARYRLGLALERKGQMARAREEWTRFLESWKDADADLPEVRDARQRLRVAGRLGDGPRSSRPI